MKPGCGVGNRELGSSQYVITQPETACNDRSAVLS